MTYRRELIDFWPIRLHSTLQIGMGLFIAGESGEPPNGERKPQKKMEGNTEAAVEFRNSSTRGRQQGVLSLSYRQVP